MVLEYILCDHGHGQNGVTRVVFFCRLIMSFGSLKIGSSRVSSSSSHISSSSSSSGRANGRSCNPSEDDKSFSEMINVTCYEPLKKVKGKYEIFIDCNKLHWLLLIKMKDSKLHFFSLEVSTPDLSSFRHEMFLFDGYEGGRKYCGEIDAKLEDILDAADRIVVKMEKYRLLSSNCQHFCNNFLNHYSFEVYRTTIGKDVTASIRRQPDVEAELLRLLDQWTDDPLGSPIGYALLELQIRTRFARILDAYVGRHI